MPHFQQYNVYKGLQKPLIFKGFKGRFIYIGAGIAISSLIICALVSSLVSFVWGGFALIVIMFGGFALIAQQQKKGLHRKDKSKGVFVVHKIFWRD